MKELIEIGTMTSPAFLEADSPAAKSIMKTLGVTTVEDYEAGDGWRWRLKNPDNHQIIGAASEGFHDQAECRENFRRIYREVGGTKAIRWVEVES